MDKKKIIEMLNEDLSDELGSTIQYMWHHVMCEGMASAGVRQDFLKTAMDEMKHAEKLAEKVNYLGGIPTTRVSEVKVGGDLNKMVKDDLDGEQRAIKRYKEQVLALEDEPAVRHLLEELLLDEEDHADLWMALLGINNIP